MEGGEEKEVCFGLTFPLLTKADGRKFGKSEDGAVWLSAGNSKQDANSCCRASGNLHRCHEMVHASLADLHCTPVDICISALASVPSPPQSLIFRVSLSLLQTSCRPSSSTSTS